MIDDKLKELLTACTQEHQLNEYQHPLRWSQELGVGYLCSTGYDYGAEYWEKYQGYVNDLGAQLSEARTNFILQNLGTLDSLCDVGIGSGQFVMTAKCKGFDVNPYAVQWLTESGYFADVYAESFETLSFWDVLEHLDDPSQLLNKTKNIFMSVPIHTDVQACLRSKHLRPSEHIWHFTDAGLKSFMAKFGFKFMAVSSFETSLGREDILSYFFTKV